MIPALIFALQVSSMPEIHEYPAATQDSVSIEAIVTLPPLNPAQRYLMGQALTLAVQRTQEYGSRDVLRVLKTGTRFRLYQAADHLRIGLTVEPKDLGTGLSLLRSVMTKPSFLEDTIKAKKSSVKDPWQPAYNGFSTMEVGLNQPDILQIWQGIMRPKNISVAVGGNFTANDPTEKWTTTWRGWNPPLETALPLKYPPKQIDLGNPVPLLIFDSKPIKLTRDNMPLYFLAANALGVGKESILWQIAREEMGLSYRQESFLLPTDEGWRFRMAFATDDQGVKPETIAKLREKIRASCAALTQADLDHAIGLGKGYLKNSIPTMPLILGIGSAVTNDPNDQLYLRHYWLSKFGFVWSADSLYGQMQTAKLEDLKKLLLQLVDQSDVHVF
ncbi:MAG: insulinase family protein [Armatimonadetes bacterium]|nr:insulinase family protein [Armatimonadota bacterium]